MKPKNLVISLGLSIVGFVLIGSIALNSVKRSEDASSTPEVRTPTNTPSATEVSSQNDLPVPTSSPQVVISQEQTEYKDDKFKFSFTYPSSLNFETQSPYPGGTIKVLTLRVDGITDSTLLYKDLSKSLMKNDLYCNLDSSYGSAVCTNQKVDPYTNTQGTSGYIVTREKQLYMEDREDPVTYTDVVYAFPLKVDSSYKVIVLSVKYPSEENLKLLKQISNTVNVY